MDDANIEKKSTDISTDESAPEYLSVDGEEIAIRHRQGKQPGIFWLCGYRSDMLGMKAQEIDKWARQRGLAITRHDYSGHGQSTGKYYEGTISKWLAQSLAVFRRYTPPGHRQILVGSSMGTWIALRMIQILNKELTAEKQPIAGLLLLAPAPDFITELMEPALTEIEREQLKTEGSYVEKSDYFPDEPGNIWTREFFEDARMNNRVLDGPIEPGCPVHIIHGLMDKEVPVKLVDKLAQLLPANQTERTQVPEGDHRLSRPEDIELILKSLESLVAKVDV